LCDRAQIKPNIEADQESGHGRHKKRKGSFSRAQCVSEGGDIDAHERNECAEVQQFRG
jgi:hypothetical protein